MKLETLSTRHLLGIEGLPTSDILTIFRTASLIDQESRESVGSLLSGRTVVNLFVEDSTRTRNSFHLAATRLGASVLSITGQGSSLSKGESLRDTLCVLEAMGIDALVLRHSSAGAPHYLATGSGVPVINAGDGRHEHPTQALLDGYTLYRQWEPTEEAKAFQGKTIGIVGDIAHGRVALSNIFLLRKLGARVLVCGPPTLIPRGVEALGVEVVRAADDLLASADAVIMLRMQLERQGPSLVPSLAEYSRLYGLTADRLRRIDREDLLILHPGPVNRGVELAPEIADGDQSLILKQVTNGVSVRMAVLALLLSGSDQAETNEPEPTS